MPPGPTNTTPTRSKPTRDRREQSSSCAVAGMVWSACAAPDGMRVVTFTIAVFLLPYSASHPPVMNWISFTSLFAGRHWLPLRSKRKIPRFVPAIS